MCHAILIEKAQGNYSAYVTDLPGYIATGLTIEKVEKQIKEAINFHLEGLRQDGLPIAKPTTLCEYVEVA